MDCRQRHRGGCALRQAVSSGVVIDFSTEEGLAVCPGAPRRLEQRARFDETAVIDDQCKARILVLYAPFTVPGEQRPRKRQLVAARAKKILLGVQRESDADTGHAHSGKIIRFQIKPARRGPEEAGFRQAHFQTVDIPDADLDPLLDARERRRRVEPIMGECFERRSDGDIAQIRRTANARFSEAGTRIGGDVIGECLLYPHAVLEEAMGKGAALPAPRADLLAVHVAGSREPLRDGITESAGHAPPACRRPSASTRQCRRGGLARSCRKPNGGSQASSEPDGRACGAQSREKARPVLRIAPGYHHR